MLTLYLNFVTTKNHLKKEITMDGILSYLDGLRKPESIDSLYKGLEATNYTRFYLLHCANGFIVLL
jgi:hypothetical protein